MTDTKASIIEPSYFSNWADIFMPKIAYKLLPFVAKFPFITPNIVTITSFVFYVLGALLLFITIPYHLLLSALFLPFSYILDCVDGQLARFTNRGSQIGDYLDKTLDVAKIFFLTFSLAIATYIQTESILFIFLGFIACFCFTFRYYIKLETIFSMINKDKDYLEKSRNKRWVLYAQLTKKYTQSKGLYEKMGIFLHKNRALVFVDEAEFVVFTSIAALFNQLVLVLWLLAISQCLIACFRFFERAFQLVKNQDRLYLPMRK